MDAQRQLLSADLTEQFGPGPAFPGDCLTLTEELGFQCTAFPNEQSRWDSALAALIQAAIALPVHVVLLRLFQITNQQDEEERWLSWSWLRSLLLGRMAWRWEDPRVAPSPATMLVARTPDAPVTAVCRAWMSTSSSVVHRVTGARKRD